MWGCSKTTRPAPERGIDMITYVQMEQEYIEETAERMVALAQANKDVVQITFDCVQLTVDADTDPADATMTYYAALEEQRKQARKKLLKDAPDEPTICDPVAWNTSYPNPAASSYVQVTYDYAVLWARLMEASMKAGNSLEDCAGETSELAITEDIGTHQFSHAASALGHAWTHGKELEAWFRREYLNESDDDDV